MAFWNFVRVCPRHLFCVVPAHSAPFRICFLAFSLHTNVKFSRCLGQFHLQIALNLLKYDIFLYCTHALSFWNVLWLSEVFLYPPQNWLFLIRFRFLSDVPFLTLSHVISISVLPWHTYDKTVRKFLQLFDFWFQVNVRN